MQCSVRVGGLELRPDLNIITISAVSTNIKAARSHDWQSQEICRAAQCSDGAITHLAGQQT